MDNNFSWMQIHAEGNKYSLYLYNKKGLVKRLFSSDDLEIVQRFMTRREASKKRIGEALTNAIQELMTNPEALKRLQENNKGE